MAVWDSVLEMEPACFSSEWWPRLTRWCGGSVRHCGTEPRLVVAVAVHPLKSPQTPRVWRAARDIGGIPSVGVVSRGTHNSHISESKLALSQVSCHEDLEMQSHLPHISLHM
ncbi:hypothetical protein, unlikely [Trypanosoma congolense IL3000]|uniref:Uncharacterized protein n=1 Tax=Trypanosoma congolense (strain IL3000) TaxID=1068625 RepID=F9W5J2_TRYCI|nr:hypothetical protein, unlikely [Trypanosoma congolense IL3000]